MTEIDPIARLRWILAVGGRIVADVSTASAVSGLGRVRPVDTRRDAVRELSTPTPWLAVAVDLCLPDGCGLDVIRHARHLDPRPRSLLLTCDGFVHDAANAAFDLGGVCLVSPAGAERVAQFLSAGRPLSTCVPRTARAWRARYQLSAGETDVLIRSALGECRVAIASNSGSAVATVKKQISNLLRKTSEESLHATAERLFRDAMCM